MRTQSYIDATKYNFAPQQPLSSKVSSSRSPQVKGSIDSSFNVAVTEGFGYVNDSVVQPDGKIIVVGLFQRANGIRTNGIVRFNSNGTVDPSFVLGSGANLVIRTVELLPDGKILIGGLFTVFNDQAVNKLVRLNPNGSIDSSFSTAVVFSSQINDLHILPDGKILAGGAFVISSSRLVRLNSDGSLDSAVPGFNSTVISIEPGNNGRVLVGGGFSSPRRGLARLLPDGTVDPTFAPSTGAQGAVYETIVQPDGKILAAGAFTSFNGVSTESLVRLNDDGSINTTYDVTDDPDVQNLEIYSLALQSNGKLLVGQTVLSSGSDITRFNSDGTIDGTFVSAVNRSVYDINFAADGKLLAGGSFTKINGDTHFRLAKLNTDGSLDNTFSTEVSTTGIVYAIERQNDGKIIIGGDFNRVNGVDRSCVARLNNNGSLDTSFDVGRGCNGDVYSISIQSDGKVILGGFFGGDSTFPAFAAARVNANGSFDIPLATGSNGILTIYDTAVQNDGKIVLAGQILSSGSGLEAALRLNSDGTTDSSFDAVQINSGTIRSILVQANNKILVGGTFIFIGGVSRNGLARLNSNGTLDASFVGILPNTFAIYKDASENVFASGFSVAKFDVNGNSDPIFSPGSGFNSVSRALVVQPDGRIIIGGGFFSSYNGTPVNRLVRLNVNGSIDTTFLIGSGPSGPVYSLALQQNGKVLVGGQFTGFDGMEKDGLVRLGTSVFRSLFDYDGDGRADLSVRRPSDNIWYLLQSTAGFTGITWGVVGDRMAPADYDGDGRTDVAVFRPSTGQWFVVNSSNLTFTTYSWGQDGDLPVPTDR
ncbi:MAG: hypothetical protein HOP17_06015, partial [Acidobacteria bacterium]|nr:hypothetical protein [Acidobacteriota bacterium]